MKLVQFTLAKGVYKDPLKLAQAIEEVRATGGFVKLDTRYASRIGVLSGELPDDRVAALEKLDIVSALELNTRMRALG